MVGVAFICCTFVAKIKCHSITLFWTFEKLKPKMQKYGNQKYKDITN